MADTSRAEMLLGQAAQRPGGEHVVKLARAVSLAVLVEPGLLRRARIHLVPGADAGTESDLWFSPLVLTRNITGIVLDPDVLTVLRHQLAAASDPEADNPEADDPEFAIRARDLVARLHARHPPSIQLEEEVIWQAVRYGNAAQSQIEERLRTAVKAMVTDPDEGWDVARWAAQAWRRLPEIVTQTEAAHLLAVGAALRLGTAAGVASFGERMPASVRWLTPSNSSMPILLGVELAADGLRFVEPATDGLVLELPGTSPLVLEIGWYDGTTSHSEVMTVAPGTEVPLGSMVGHVTLRTLAGQRYVIEPETANRPDQATDAGFAGALPAPAPPNGNGLGSAARASCAIYVDGSHTGTGTLVTDSHVLTVAHVVRRSGELLTIRFSEGLSGEAIPVDRLSLGTDAEELDIAVLMLGPSGERPAPVRLWPARRLPLATGTFGFPFGTEEILHGVWRYSQVSGIAKRGRVQLDWVDAGTVPGQSGGAVCDRQSGLMVGVLVEGSNVGHFDRMIPLSAVRRVWDGLPRPWLFAGENAWAHFIQRAEGQRSTARGGDLFRGRRQALAAVRGWFSAVAGPGVPLVITGQPGAGKSAVLARATLDIERTGRSDGVAFHARGAVAVDLVDAVAAACGLDTPDSWQELVATLAAQDRRDVLAVAVDALDEAASDYDLADLRQALRELARLDWLRIAVATRALASRDPYDPGTHLSALGVTGGGRSSNLVDLDSDRYFAVEDLISYVDSMLAQSSFANPGPPGGAWQWYRQNPQARAQVAQVVANQADRNYLVAGMSAFQLSEDDTVLDPASATFDSSAVPRGIGEALRKYLDTLPVQRRRRAEGLLTALAYGSETGVDDDRWLAFTHALGYDDVTIEDVAELKASAAADYLLETSTEMGGLTTRLFHPALVDELLARRDRSGDEARLRSLADNEARLDSLADTERTELDLARAAHQKLQDAMTVVQRTIRAMEEVEHRSATPAGIESWDFADQEATHEQLAASVTALAAGLESSSNSALQQITNADTSVRQLSGSPFPQRAAELAPLTETVSAMVSSLEELLDRMTHARDDLLARADEHAAYRTPAESLSRAHADIEQASSLAASLKQGLDAAAGLDPAAPERPARVIQPEPEVTRSEQGGIARVELRHVPVVGQQFAVQPYPVGRDGEDLSLPAQYAREDTFGVRVRGDSMAGDGVLDGDYVVVDPRGEVRDREMVVVGLGDPGDSEVVVRRLRRHNSTIRLESSNPDVEPIILGPDDTPVIYGTVIAVVRRLARQYAREGTFGVRVRGDSMAGDGVLDGDYVVVDPRGEVRDREMVVVGLGDPGDSEVVVRRLRRHNSTIRLESSNPDVEPIILGPDDTPVIYGTVIAAVRHVRKAGLRT